MGRLMATRMSKGPSEREQFQRAIDGHSWASVRSEFRRALLDRNVQLSPLVAQTQVQTPQPFIEEVWFTWWRRDDFGRRLAKVQQHVAENYVTEVNLHGGWIASPGQLRTVALFVQAAEVGDEAIDAILIRALLSAMDVYVRPKADRNFPLGSVDGQLWEWAGAYLSEVGIEDYWHANTRHFFPIQLPGGGAVATVSDLTNVLADKLAAVLLEWVPVALAIESADGSSPYSPT